MMKLVRSLSALVVGYAVIVLLTTFGFDAVHRLFAVHDTWGSPPPVIIAAAFVAVAAGLAGGFTASFIGYRRPLHSAALVVVPLLADSTYVLFFYHGHAPFWFELAGSITLIAATLCGGLLRELKAPRRFAT
jgi:hypothetical protein